jgi:Zn-dependent M16 (insulinase) family peptidase
LPHNSLLLVIGSISPLELLKTISEKFEPSIPPQATHSSPTAQPSTTKSERQRPWLETGSYQDPKEWKLESKVEVVEFPEESEESGEVWMSWKGPEINVRLSIFGS